ncbi:hypothetical protein GCM10011594_19510 [Nakamurella endophytica]|uniref:Uncharacterized protein n=1 Tax=Nakamurella endophytica TaxID=1748367 RepID=A0A917SUS1_9ACTN|nr:hypothetical protein GCM10011594_19510 [Nakamurella endophytica]
MEKAWLKFWDVYNNLLKLPKQDWKSALDGVATGSLVSTLLAQAAAASKDGVDNYGQMGHRPYWGPKIDGRETASIGDCVDESEFGTYRVATKQKLTVGRPRVNFRGILNQSRDGSWRVVQVQFLKGTQC